MTWIIREQDDFEGYLTEMGHNCVYWGDVQRDAHRFENQGYAYRVAAKWGGRVLKLVKRAAPSEGSAK